MLAYRWWLKLVLTWRWAALVPTTVVAALMVEMSVILSDHSNPIEELERTIWGLAASLIAATALFTLSHHYYRNPLYRTCGEDKTECRGNLKQHH